MQRLDQISYLSENYELKFTNSSDVYNNRKRFIFINEKRVKRDTIVYEYQPNDFKENKNLKTCTQYYVLKETDERINDKPVYFPKRVIREGSLNAKPSVRENIFDFFDLSNKKEILRNPISSKNKNETFVYVNGPLKGMHVSPDIDIFHVQKQDQKIKFGLRYVLIYKETEDRIEVHPVQVKTLTSINENKTKSNYYYSRKDKEKVKEKLIDNKNNRNRIFAAQTLSNLSIFAEQELMETEHDEVINYPLTPGRDTEEQNKIEEISSAPKLNNLKTIKFIMLPMQEEINYPLAPGREIEEENKEIIKTSETKKRKITFLFIDPEKEPENKKQNINIDKDKKQNLIDRLKKKQQDEKNKETREKFKQQEREQFNENNESTKIIPGAKIEIQKRIVTMGRTSKK